MLPGALILIFVDEAGAMLLRGHSRKSSYSAENQETMVEGDMPLSTVSLFVIGVTVKIHFKVRYISVEGRFKLLSYCAGSRVHS